MVYFVQWIVAAIADYTGFKSRVVGIQLLSNGWNTYDFIPLGKDHQNIVGHEFYFLFVVILKSSMQTFRYFNIGHITQCKARKE